ncbi:chromosomal replication initiator protein DnaA [Campylobacter sp. MG1]|uniref:chromosomal replication initiator protein DnaA n=1 Tax=Campylobacter sp. MG1 TaxID=2976332 RepID=UPI00226CEEA1|nr:chromosomal replication initiator protein DnaA [Campylobacter sp. MG1]
MINNIIEKLKNEIGESQFKNYFEICEIKENDNNINIKAPNQFIAKHIETKFKNIIKNIIQSISSNDYQINIYIKNQENNQNKKEVKLANIKKQISILNESYTFNNFIVGKNNRYAYEICKAITNENKFGKDFNPIFIHSNTGLGKTHLLQASGHECLEIGKKVIYKTSKGFMNDYQNALMSKKFDNFNNQYKDCDLLLIDDVQFLGNTDKIQEEFFHIFNDIIQRNGQIIMTSDVAPKNLNGIEERLKSRFGNGVITNIDVPDLDTKKAIIKKKSQVNDIYLNDEMINTIANYIGENIRDLESIITNIRGIHLFTGQEITLELVKNQIKEYVKEKQKNIEIEDIFNVISYEFNIKINDIKSNSKKQNIVKAKRIAIFLAKELISNSISQIATNFQMKDHSAVSKHIKKINEILINDDSFRENVEILKNKIINSKNKEY